MQKTSPEEQIYFHIFNRGVEKRLIFLDDHDRWRFITLLLLLQSTSPVISRISYAAANIKHSMLDDTIVEDILQNRYVELISFCLMPNHFHLILASTTVENISKFMQRFANAYTKYFNTRHERSGHLFGSRFHHIHINDNEYLNYLSAYVHLNPKELKNWNGKEFQYPWSSFQDFVEQNRWGKLLNPSIVLGQFKNGSEYKMFVEKTPIKESLPDEYFLDK